MNQTYTPPAPATSATFGSLRRGLFVVWVMFSLAALGFVVVVGTNAPIADEWEFVPALVGEAPAGPWLWQQHNEHRFPLPRTLYLALFRATHDFRAGMFTQVLMVSALALALMRYADRLRGRPHWADAFFPISLLHVGHWENFLMGYQVCFVLFAVLSTGLVVVALRATRERAFRSGLSAGALALLLALCGGTGLVVCVPACAWILYLAVCVWRGGSKGRGLLVFLVGVLPLVYLGVYFIDYQKPPLHPELSADPVRVLRAAGEVLGMSFGMGLSRAWPIVTPALLGLGGFTVALLLKGWRAQPEGRPAVVGLIAVTAGVAGVAVAIGVGRGGWDRWSANGEWEHWSASWARYSLLVWPLLAAAYLVWVRAGRKWVPIILCVVAALAFPGNIGVGMYNGARVKTEFTRVEADSAAGLTPEQIVSAEENRYNASRGESAHVLQRDRAIRGIPLLRAARIGIFAR